MERKNSSSSWIHSFAVVTVLAAGSAYGASEQWPQCKDGIDNDIDGFTDSADRDCSVEWLIPETFHSDVAASVNGWTLINGVGAWGWNKGKGAGGSSGEARATSYTAGTKRYYADLDLPRPLTFTEDWYASGKMDFLANSASDGGMVFGFFDANTSFAEQTLTTAGFILVNGGLRIRVERRPGLEYIESSDMGLWINADRIFKLVYDADGGGNGIGRLTGTLIRVSDGTKVVRSIDIPQNLTNGAQLNGFGFFAEDVFQGRSTPFSWAVDDLSYGPK